VCQQSLPIQDKPERFGQLVYDWGRFTKKLLGYYQGRGETGQAPYNAAIMLKMLLLSYLWNVSGRMTEIVANDSLSIGLFLGLGADENILNSGEQIDIEPLAVDI
jgi:hypothetical protein